MQKRFMVFTTVGFCNPGSPTGLSLSHTGPEDFLTKAVTVRANL